jgi:molybdopterin synthase catalytic subunit
MAAPTQLTLLYFAAARERTGTAKETLTFAPGEGPKDVAALLEKLTDCYPGLAPLLGRMRVAVNEEFSSESDALPDGAEVALIPPVAGGAGRFLVVDRPLMLDEVTQAVAHPSRGGIVTFSGAVREVSQGKRVVRLEYEAYAPMAVKELTRIGDEAARRWPGVVAAIVHRVGKLLPGELAVVMAAAAPHRKEAFLACQFAIEELKKDVPIWKRECFEDGASWVGLGP